MTRQRVDEADGDRMWQVEIQIASTVEIDTQLASSIFTGSMGLTTVCVCASAMH